jgi:ParB-like chromosome segregation protein Spo0J
MDIKNIAVKDLIPYEKNTKKHDDVQINNVAESIKQYGFVQPIVIDKNNVVVIGHCRLLAAKKLKMAEVPCVYVDDLTEEQVKALRIVDNKSNQSPWDFDFLADELADLDLSDFEFDFGLPSSDIDWASVEDLDEKTYEEPEHKMLQCPHCQHIDRDIHFKKV